MIQKAKGDPTNLKLQNKLRIFDAIYHANGISRTGLAKDLNLSLPTVVSNLTSLIEQGLIRENGYIGQTGGRRAHAYSIVPDAQVAIGLDITKHHITASTVGLDGKIMKTTRIRYDFSREESYWKKLGDVVENIISASHIEKERILGVGFGVPGLVTEDHQRIFYGKILDFEGLDAMACLKYIPYETRLFNDASAAGFAECWECNDINNAFYIMLSNNVGGAVIYNGEAYLGKNICAGEVGHIKLHTPGRQCYCGQSGCADLYCSATVLSSKYDGSLDGFFSALSRQNEKAVALWNIYLDDLAHLINVVRLLFDCKIIIGGYVGACLDPYIDNLRERVKQLDTFRTPVDDVVTCHYKTEAIAAGAALHFISQYINQLS